MPELISFEDLRTAPWVQVSPDRLELRGKVADGCTATQATGLIASRGILSKVGCQGSFAIKVERIQRFDKKSGTWPKPYWVLIIMGSGRIEALQAAGFNIVDKEQLPGEPPSPPPLPARW